MNTKKIIALISGLDGIVIGIATILSAVPDMELPKPL